MPKFLANVDLSKNELQNARIQNLATSPSSPVAGQLYYDTDDNTLYFWDGSAWVAAKSGAPSGSAGGDLSGTYPNPQIAAGVIVNADVNSSAAIARSKLDFGSGLVNADIASGAAIVLSKLAVDPLARANHTGTQTAATVSDFDTQVRTSRLDQMAAPTASVAFNSQKITGLLDPTNPQDAATKAYVDAARSGLDVKQSMRAATTGVLPNSPTYANGTAGVGATLTAGSNAALAAQDGITLAVDDRLLVKDQAAGLQNGLYTVTVVGSGAAAWVLTRATDADQAAEVSGGLFTFIEEGTTQADSGFVLTADGPIVMGTTALPFAQFSGAGQIVAGAGLTKTGNTIDAVGTSNRITVAADTIDISTSYVGQATITTLGTITTGVWTGTDVAVADGGTGASTAAAARTNLGVPGKYAVDVGDGSATSITVTHNLGTKDVHATIYDLTTPFAEVVCDIEHATTNTLTLKFAVAPTSAQYRAVVVG